MCIVGNSPNVLNREVGEFVDACDRVIRINDFRVEGFEKHVGSRIDIVSYGFSPINKIRKEDVAKASEVWCCRPFLPSRRMIAITRLGKDSGIHVPSDSAWSNAVRVVNHHPRSQPSSGLATIMMAIERFSADHAIYILGFDDEKYKKHYFDPSFHDNDGEPGHDWGAEMKHIAELILAGVLRVIP